MSDKRLDALRAAEERLRAERGRLPTPPAPVDPCQRVTAQRRAAPPSPRPGHQRGALVSLLAVARCAWPTMPPCAA